MKLKDITNCSERWATPLGTMDGNAAVADGVLVDLYWGTSIIGLAVQCPDGKYFGSIRAPGNVYDQVLEFLKRNHGRKLREVMDAEIGHLRRGSVILMAKYLQRGCPKCNGYLGIVIPERKAKMTVQAINGCA
jgi:hypothetical protein